FLHRFLDRFEIDIADRDFGALGRELESRRATDALACPCDDRDLSGQTHERFSVIFLRGFAPRRWLRRADLNHCNLTVNIAAHKLYCTAVNKTAPKYNAQLNQRVDAGIVAQLMRLWRKEVSDRSLASLILVNRQPMLDDQFERLELIPFVDFGPIGGVNPGGEELSPVKGDRREALAGACKAELDVLGG